MDMAGEVSGNFARWESICSSAVGKPEFKRIGGLMIRKDGFHVLFNLAADSMFILDPDGFIREINQTAHARLGYTRAEMLGKHIGEFILPEFSGKLVGRIEKAQSQEFLIYESAQVHKDGTVLPIEVCSRAIVLWNQITFTTPLFSSIFFINKG